MGQSQVESSPAKQSKVAKLVFVSSGSISVQSVRKEDHVEKAGWLEYNFCSAICQLL